MKKRAITLLEVLIVMILIGLIGGVVSYNLKGTLDKGKNFRSKEGAHKLEDIINLELQLCGGSAKDLIDKNNGQQKLLAIIKNSGLVSKPEEFIKDGWGQYYMIEEDFDTNRVKVRSLASENYEKARSQINISP
jgi:general secretion pathway protein G